MEIIHFSDTHLGFSDLDVVNSDGVNQRESDFYKAFSDVIDAILEKKPDFVIHTGDLFHRVSPSNRAISFAIKEFQRLKKHSIPLIMIAGNHSTPRTTNSLPILDIFDGMDNIYAVYKQRYEVIEFEDVLFHTLPHINDESIMIEELKRVEKNISKNKKNIMMMHCSVGAHYLMHEFGEWVYPKEFEYLFEKMDYVALGHWHGFGRVGKYKNVFYSGSTERTSSSDKRDKKGFVEVSLNDGLDVKHHKIALRKSLSFRIDSKKFEEEIDSLDLTGIKDALVEVRLFNLSASTSIDISNQQIYEIFKEALYVKVTREFIKEQSTPLEQGVEAISLEEYFLSFVKDSIENKNQRERLTQKIKELFAKYEESSYDTH